MKIINRSFCIAFNLFYRSLPFQDDLLLIIWYILLGWFVGITGSKFMEYEGNISDTIRKYLEAILNDLGELTWAYVVLSKKDLSYVFSVTNYPDEWVRRYKENNLQHIDPVVSTALHRLTPFAWSKKLMTNTESQQYDIFSQAKAFDIVSGYTFVLHDYNNNLAMLSFITSIKKTEITHTIAQNKGHLSLLLASIHTIYLDIYVLLLSTPKKIA